MLWIRYSGLNSDSRNTFCFFLIYILVYFSISDTTSLKLARQVKICALVCNVATFKMDKRSIRVWWQWLSTWWPRHICIKKKKSKFLLEKILATLRVQQFEKLWFLTNFDQTFSTYCQPGFSNFFLLKIWKFFTVNWRAASHRLTING